MNDKTAENRDLADKYLELVGKRKLYPALNSYSAFVQGSEYSVQRYFKKWYNDTCRYEFFVYMKEGFSQVWLTDEMTISSTFVLKEYFQKRQDFEKRMKFFTDSIQQMEDIYPKYTYEYIKSLSYEQLLPLVEKVRDIIWDANASATFSIYLDKKICIDTLKEIAYPLSREKLDALWERAVEPAFESFDRAQLKHFLTLVSRGMKWSDIIDQCQYMLTDYYSARDLAEVDKTLRAKYQKYMEPESARQALEDEKLEVEESIKNHERWLETLQTQEEKYVAFYLQNVMMVRDRRKNFFGKGIAIIYRVAEKMFDEIGLDKKLIPYYTVRELLKGPEYLKEHANDVKKRSEGFEWLIPYASEPEMLLRNIDEAKEKINAYYVSSHIEKNASDNGGKQSEIRGQIGSKGVARGIVRIVTNVNSNHGFKEGEILVTGMTRPEYVPLMKMAAAIVTDEGGITCHAAIVSRELKKPCIISTKIGTKVLHDGDTVEVDADNGVVRVIK